MKKITLSKGQVTLVDDEFFEEFNQYKWYRNAWGYAVREVGGRKDKQRIYMHRLVNDTPEGMRTDHINHDRLDNRKENLRSVSASQNGHNRKNLNPNNTSGYSGVVWRKDIQKWSARIKVQYQQRYLGCYADLKDAISARKVAEQKVWNL